jgi:hypothetical protein
MWLNKVTLDIIGLAGNCFNCLIIGCSISRSESHVGFNYTFDSLHSPAKENNDIYGAIRSVLSFSTSRSPVFALQLFFPIFRLIVSIPLYLKGGGVETELTQFFYSLLVALVLLIALSKKLSTLDPNLSRTRKLPCSLSAMLMGPVP